MITNLIEDASINVIIVGPGRGAFVSQTTHLKASVSNAYQPGK